MPLLSNTLKNLEKHINKIEKIKNEKSFRESVLAQLKEDLKNKKIKRKLQNAKYFFNKLKNNKNN